MSTPSERGGGLLPALLLLGLVLALAGLSYRPPEPKPENAPAEEFSAGRARLLLRDLLGDGAPHPVGSAANARIRELLLARFRALGFQPEVEPGAACNSLGSCATVHNVLALLPGRVPGPPVVLCAHYDSVDYGPGAADDLTSVAGVLEIARILKSGPPPRNPVLFLLTDGEEAGLLGARVFAAGPHARNVGAVINLDARGTAGPSIMFETGHDDAWLIRLWARAATRPVASSLFSTLYRGILRSSTATDFTIFERAGMAGLNFAFIKGQPNYHTGLDNLANASPASLQHQGGNAFEIVQALANAELGPSRRGSAVYFDLWGRRLIWWPQSWALPLASLGLLLVGVEIFLLIRRRRLTGAALAGGLATLLAVLSGSALAGFGLSRALASALPVNWVEDPRPDTAAFWLLALAAGGAVAALAARRAGLSGLWAGVWGGWALAGLAAALYLPGASYLLVVPALFAGLAALRSVIPASSQHLSRVASILPAVVMAVLWFPVILFLSDGLGAQGLAVVTLLVAACVSTLAPLFAESGRRLKVLVPAIAAAAALAASGLALATPPFSRQAPQKIGVVYHEDADSGAGRWLLFGDLPAPAALRKLMPLTEQPAMPWSSEGDRTEGAPAPGGLTLEAPRLTVEADSATGGKRRLRLRLSSPRGAISAMLVLPTATGLESITIGGAVVPRRTNGSFTSDGDWHIFTCSTVPPEGVVIELVLAEAKPFTAYVADTSPGLPPIPSGLALTTAAQAENTVKLGDLTMVSRRLSI